MVRIAAALAIATLFAGSVLAQTPEVAVNDLAVRDINNVDDIEFTREDLVAILGREFVEDMEVRDPFGIGLAFKGLKFLGKTIAHSIHNHHHNNRELEFEDDVFERDVSDDLAEREPFGIGLAFKGLKFLGKTIAHSIHNHHHKRELEFEDDIYERDLSDDLEEREPFGIGLAFKGLKFLGKTVAHAIHNRQHKRDLDSEEDVFEREYEDDIFERDFDMEDLLERDIYDDLD
jgi:hypothetical protein